MECFKIYIEKYFKLYDFLVINLIKVLFVLEYIKFIIWRDLIVINIIDIF